MKKTFVTIAVVAASGWLLAAPAAADECSPAAYKAWTDESGAYTRVGAHKLADMCFEAADTTGDGRINRQEWSNSINAWFSSLDANNDDRITHNEFLQNEPGTAE